MKHDKAYKKAYGELTTTGGLKIYTTLSVKDQTAANRAVFYVRRTTTTRTRTTTLTPK